MSFDAATMAKVRATLVDVSIRFGPKFAVAGLGVAGAGIALATQGVLSNAVAGLTIIFTKPYRVGEYIEIVGVACEADLAAALIVISEIVRANARVPAEPAALVQASTLADSAVVIAVKRWVSVADFVPIPYPQRKIRLLKQDSA